MRGFRVLAFLFIAAAVACSSAGSGSTGASAAGGAAGTTVNATLTDNKITVDKPSAAPGNVTFEVANKGTVVHSFLILKTDVAQDKIPADPQNAAKVQEPGLVKGTGPIPAGQSKQISAKLDPGSYVLICNEPAHYQIGMHVAFTVK